MGKKVTHDVKMHVKAAPEYRHHIVKQHHIRLCGCVDLKQNSKNTHTRASRLVRTRKNRLFVGDRGWGHGTQQRACHNSSRLDGSDYTLSSRKLFVRWTYPLDHSVSPVATLGLFLE